ncbi:MAG: zf-HC2 domain-containing protein [Elusimicrobia bacterium]|nr:zf-HC2 domain-containing protein [Elusimicrobiota bacterium]
MECRFKEKLLLYFYGELDEVGKAPVSEHLNSCKDCRNDLEALKKISDYFEETTASPPDLALENVLNTAAAGQTGFREIIKVFRMQWKKIALGLSFAAVFVVSVNVLTHIDKPDLTSMAWETSAVSEKLDSMEYSIYKIRFDTSLSYFSDFDYTYEGIQSQKEEIEL